MTERKRLTTILFLLLWGTSLAGIGWEKNVIISPSASFQPTVQLNGESPVVAYEKKESDGIYLHIYSPHDGFDDKFLLGKTENFYEYNLLVISNRIILLYAAASNLNLVIKDTASRQASGIKSTTSLHLDNTHSPAIYFNSATSTSLIFFDRIQNGHHGLYLLTTPNLTSAEQLSKATLLVNEADTNLKGSFFPYCAFDGKNIFLVFSKRTGTGIRQTDAVYLMISKDNGVTWTPAREISLPGNDSSFPWVSTPSPGNVIISYLKAGPDNRTDPVILTSSDAGAIFNSSVFSNFNQMLFFPRTFTVNGSLRLFAYDYSRDNHAVIFEKTFIPETASWSDPRTISPTNANALNYKQAYNNQKVYVTWQDENGAIFFIENDITAPAPEVFSSVINTNYDYAGSTPELQWKTAPDPSGIRGYAYMLDMMPLSTPDIENVSADISGKTFNSIGDGVWYFHIRSIDQANNWSDTTHFRFIVNTIPLSPPIIQSPTHGEFLPSQNRNVEFQWIMGSDRHKIIGYSYLLSTREDLEPEEKINITETNIFFKDIKPGLWKFSIKACDQEKRWSTFAIYTINIEEPIVDVSEADYRKISMGEFNEQESAITYTIGKGDILSRIIQKVLGLKPQQDFKEYLKEVVKYNDIQNADNLQLDNKVHIPVLIADQETDLGTIAETIFGNPKAKSKIFLHNSTSTNEVKIGDKILIRDKYFLKTGHLRKTEEDKVKKNGLKLNTESTNILLPVQNP